MREYSQHPFFPSPIISLPSFFLSLTHRDSHQHTFSIFRPKLSLSELHVHEGDVKSVLTEEMWHSLCGPDGRITESRCVKKVCLASFPGSSLLPRNNFTYDL